MQGTGTTYSWREKMPAILMDLISKRPDRLLRLVEMSYSELRRAVEDKPKADLLRRLEAKTAGLDNARLNLHDWISQQTKKMPGEAEAQRLDDLRNVKQNLDGDLERMRLVLQGAALLQPHMVQAKALEALVGVHISLKQLRKHFLNMLEADKVAADSPREKDTDARETSRAERHLPREGMF